MNPKEVETVPVWTFSEFAWKRYYPDQSALRSWRQATHEKFKFLMSKVEPVFGSQPLTEINLASVQSLLVKLAKNECHDTVKGMRSYLRAIFRDAREQEIIPIDPTRKLVLPQTRKPDRPFLTVDQIRLIEPSLEPRDQTILRLLTRCGLRPGEVFGLRPEDVGADRTVHIKRTFSRGRLGATKTEGSEGKVAVPESLYAELAEICRYAVPNSLPWLFPASRKRGGELKPISSPN
ncbi:MAG: tyrosine-type recombinase/integrase [Bryobacteraceae bacterium]